MWRTFIKRLEIGGAWCAVWDCEWRRGRLCLVLGDSSTCIPERSSYSTDSWPKEPQCTVDEYLVDSVPDHVYTRGASGCSFVCPVTIEPYARDSIMTIMSPIIIARNAQLRKISTISTHKPKLHFSRIYKLCLLWLSFSISRYACRILTLSNDNNYEFAITVHILVLRKSASYLFGLFATSSTLLAMLHTELPTLPSVYALSLSIVPVSGRHVV